MNLIPPMLLKSFGALDALMHRGTSSAQDVQWQYLRQLIQKNKDTYFGKKNTFGEISSEESFRKKVPMTEYGDIDQIIEKIKAGKQDLLTREPVKAFHLTSGTTASAKFIPITKQGMRNSRKHLRRWLYHALIDHPKIFNKELLSITGKSIEGYSKCGIPIGNASGMLQRSLSHLLKRCTSMPPEVSEIKNYDQRYLILARMAVERPLSLLVTPNPLTLIKLAESVDKHKEEIIRAIHNGWILSPSLDKNIDGHEHVWAALSHNCRPNKKRARFLEKIVNQTDELQPKEFWKELQLIGCWLGGSIGFHSKLLKKYYGDTALRDIGYMASEACITLPLSDNSPSGLLNLATNYYEFIPESEINSPDPITLGVEDLKTGDCYNILITNDNGLYRYNMNDIIMVEGKEKHVPVISFLRKASNVIDISGEKLHLNHCLLAIKAIQESFPIEVRQFRVVPNPDCLAHEFFICFNNELNANSIRHKIIPILNEKLCQVNMEYKSKRESKRLNPPIIHHMSGNWEEEVKRSHKRFLANDVQYKWNQLSMEKIEEDAQYIDFTVDITEVLQ